MDHNSFVQVNQDAQPHPSPMDQREAEWQAHYNEGTPTNYASSENEHSRAVYFAAQAAMNAPHVEVSPQLLRPTTLDLPSPGLGGPRSGTSSSVITPRTTEFDESPDLTYIVDPTGQLIYCSRALSEYFGYTRRELLNHSIVSLLHPEDISHYAAAFNESIMTMGNYVHYHRLRRGDGSFLLLESFGRPIYDPRRLRNTSGDAIPVCRCLVASARPYPAQTMTPIETFFHHKTQEPELRAALQLLGIGDADWHNLPVDSHAVPLTRRQSYPSDVDYSSRHTTHPVPWPDQQQPIRPAPAPHQYPYPAQRSHYQFLPPSSYPPTPLYPAPSTDHPTFHDSTVRRKSRKTKTEAEDFVCADCGTTESPEWRKGPMGPKSLCNACGLRFAKRQRKSEVEHGKQSKLEHESSNELA